MSVSSPIDRTSRHDVAPVTDADFRWLVESVADYAIFLLDAQGRIRSWNEGARRLKGYTEEEVIGRSFELFYSDEQIATGYPGYELDMAKRTGRFEDEGWRLRRDGSRFWASVVITALYDEHGAPRGFAKITRDLTERRKQEELLRQSEEMFRLMVDAVRDYAIFMLDPKGCVATWNLGAQLTKGYTAEEIIGRHFSIFYPKEKVDIDWPRQELEMVLRDGQYEEEGWRVRKDGSLFWANVVITAVYDAEGRHRGFAKVTRNLTDRRRIDALEEQERRLTQFLAVLGHELRNPLTPIANAVSIMQMDEPVKPRIIAARDILARQVPQLKRLVDDLLDLGRITSGKVQLSLRPLELQQVINEGVEAVRPLMEERGHRLTVDVGSEAMWVLGDRTRLVQVLTNLLNNAAKFTPPGGSITLSLSREADRAVLRVRDNGPGIPPEQLPRIFKLFAQADVNVVGEGHGGLGIGLSLVQQMVLLHGGDVSAHSTGISGEGAEFVVRLPLDERLSPA
ncbi:sensor histidine kinase [Noviluteimonas dokdonensis]|nr:PAS domain S-box protein [Lysobacter dokdonensis]